MSDIVVPPVTGVWYDAAATLASVLNQLRLSEPDVDQDRLAALIPAAGYLIDQYVDREIVLDGPPPDPPVQAALEQVTIVLYRAKDVAATGSSWLPADVAQRYAQSDPITDVLGLLAPYRARWGIG